MVSKKNSGLFYFSIILNVLLIGFLLIKLIINLVVLFENKRFQWDSIWDYNHQYQLRLNDSGIDISSTKSKLGDYWFDVSDSNVTLQDIGEGMKQGYGFECEIVEVKYLNANVEQKQRPALLLSKELERSWVYFFIVNRTSNSYNIVLPVAEFEMSYSLLFPPLHTVKSYVKIDTRTVKLEIDKDFEYISDYYLKDGIVGIVKQDNNTIIVSGRTRFNYYADNILIVLTWYQDDSGSFWIDMTSTSEGGWND
ncbi:MAG: hypothetical protein LBU60_06340 [Clostridiales bacterium]|jgi:hypothetical protein|nr:hypothetical protein [Clostridiales bacterium]